MQQLQLPSIWAPKGAITKMDKSLLPTTPVIMLNMAVDSIDKMHRTDVLLFLLSLIFYFISPLIPTFFSLPFTPEAPPITGEQKELAARLGD